MSLEDTFFMIKPDAIQRCLVGEIISKVEKKGLRISAMRMEQLTREDVEKLYSEHSVKPWFDALIKFSISSPVILLAISGVNAVQETRNLVKRIREEYSLSKTSNNLVHSSDSIENAKKEMNLFFNFADNNNYTRCVDQWIYAPRDIVS